MRTCTKCEKQLPATAFYRRSKGGREATCKECFKQRQAGIDAGRNPSARMQAVRDMAQANQESR